jgi:ferredoxin
VAVLTDFCNECGNCATFCPTAGRPYRDKPRLYLDRDDFAAQSDNAFLLLGNGAIEARVAGETHRVEAGETVICTTPRATVRLDPATWEVLEASVPGGSADGDLSLQACAAAYALLVSLGTAARFLPSASRGPAGASVGHPGYEE